MEPGCSGSEPAAEMRMTKADTSQRTPSTTLRVNFHTAAAKPTAESMVRTATINRPVKSVGCCPIAR